MAQSSQYGSFVPTNYIWDIQQILETDINTPQFKELLVRLYQNINTIAVVLNTKDTGMYQITENVNNQLYFSNPANNSSTPAYAALRQVLRKVVNFGALPNTGAKSVAHNIPINQSYTFTRIYGAASDTTDLEYIPLPYSAVVLANDIQLDVSATNVTVTTGANRSNYTVCYIVLEYITS